MWQQSWSQTVGRHVHQQLEVLEKIYSNDVELHISKEEGPGVTVATERDVPPDDAVLRSSVYEEGCATAAFSHID